MRKLIVWWLIIFGVIAVIAFVAGGIEAVGGVGVAAVISFLIMVKQMSSQWSGVVEDIQEKEVRVGGDEESDGRIETRLMASVRLDSGKMKKVEAGSNWRIGDRVVKERGKATVEVNPT